MGTGVQVLLAADAETPCGGGNAAADGEAPTDAADPADRALRAVEHLFRRLERRLSRFLPESELTRLNDAAGRGAPVRASRTLGSVLRDALRFAAETHGAFDPTILKALRDAGYDRSFELVAPDGPATHPPREPGIAHDPGAARPRRTWEDVRLRWGESGYVVSLPAGCAIDLGGIGKGWAVDQAARRLRRAGFDVFAVDAGGDLYVAGAAAVGSPWTIGVEGPANAGRDLLVLAVRDGAVATSTTARRRWRRGGEERHHLIDPGTGRPAQTGVVAATVIAASAARAEALAKAAVVHGPRDRLRLLEDARRAEGVLVLRGGGFTMTEGLGRAAPA